MKKIIFLCVVTVVFMASSCGFIREEYNANVGISSSGKGNYKVEIIEKDSYYNKLRIENVNITNDKVKISWNGVSGTSEYLYLLSKHYDEEKEGSTKSASITFDLSTGVFDFYLQATSYDDLLDEAYVRFSVTQY